MYVLYPPLYPHCASTGRRSCARCWIRCSSLHISLRRILPIWLGTCLLDLCYRNPNVPPQFIEYGTNSSNPVTVQLCCLSSCSKHVGHRGSTWLWWVFITLLLRSNNDVVLEYTLFLGASVSPCLSSSGFSYLRLKVNLLPFPVNLTEVLLIFSRYSSWTNGPNLWPEERSD